MSVGPRFVCGAIDERSNVPLPIPSGGAPPPPPSWSPAAPPQPARAVRRTEENQGRIRIDDSFPGSRPDTSSRRTPPDPASPAGPTHHRWFDARLGFPVAGAALPLRDARERLPAGAQGPVRAAGAAGPLAAQAPPARGRGPRGPRARVGPGPPHGLPERPLPEPERVLVAQGRDLHDPRGRLHADVPVLHGAQGEA